MPNITDITGERRQVEFPFDAWLPDHPSFSNPGFPDCQNVYPTDLGRYRPFPSFSQVGNNSLTDLVAGVTTVSSELFGIRSPDNNQVNYFCMAVDPVAGDLHFFRYDEATLTWSDVTPVTPPTAEFGSYAVFDVFGTDIYVAYGGAGLIMSKTIDDNTDFAVVTDAPEAQDIAIVRGFLVAINVTELATTSRTRVTWSAQQDPTNWISPLSDPTGALSVLRGFTQLEGGGRLQRIVPGVGGADAIIFGQTKIWRMTFIGAPKVWDFQVVEEAEGTQSMSSVLPQGNRIYFLGRRGWMVFDGARAVPIGAGKLDRAFLQPNILGNRFRFDPGPQSDFQRGLRGAVSGDPFPDKLVLYTYRSDTESTLSPIVTDGGDNLITDGGDRISATIESDFNDTVIIFNELSGQWGNAKINMQVLGRVETNRNFSDNPQLVGIDDTLNLVEFSRGITLDAYVTTAENTGVVNNPVTVRRVWPYVNNENCTIRVIHRQNLFSTPVEEPAYGLEDDAAVPGDASGRFVAVRLDLPSFDGQDEILGVSVEISDQGLGSLA